MADDNHLLSYEGSRLSDVSDTCEIDSRATTEATHGTRLIENVTTATGLPVDLIDGEISRLFARAGVHREQATLEDLRDVLAMYAQDVLLELKASS